MQPIASNSSSSDKKTLVSDDLIEFRNKNRLVINPTTVTIGTASVGGDMKFAGQANQVDARVNKVKNSTFDLKGANVTFQNVGSSNQGIEKVTLGTKEELTKHLSSFYKKQLTEVYEIREKGAWQISLPIEGVYTNLAIIGEKEKKERNDPNETFQDRRIPTHETLFKPKTPIAPKDIFKHEKLKNASQKRVVIFGAAGVGKTTFCQMTAINGADLWPEFDVVFLVRLRNLNSEAYPPRQEGYTPYDILCKECGINLKKYQRLLENPDFRKKALLIFDGYDELPNAVENGHLKQAFEGLHRATFDTDHRKKAPLFPHIMATSRPGGVGIHYINEMEIVGFDEKNVQSYVEKYYGLLADNDELSKEKEKSKIQKLKKELANRTLVHSLAQIPINLALMCSIFKEDESIFKSDKTLSVTTFYNEAVNWFYKRCQLRDRQKYQSLTSSSNICDQESPRLTNPKIDSIAKVLEEIAWQAMEDNILYLSKARIEKTLSRFKLNYGDLTSLGLFPIEGGRQGRGQFIHLTFQEFFAATYLANMYINAPSKATECFKKIKFDPRYTLTLWMAAGYLSHQEKKKALRAFFNDLFGAPEDLARGYGLILKARCFEECKCPEEIPHYKGFIDEAVESIKAAPTQEMNFQLLNRNVRLLRHPSIIKAFEENMTKKETQIETISLIGRLGQEKLLIPNEVMLTLSELVLSSDVRRYAIESLSQIVKGGGALPKKGIKGLFKVLKDSSIDWNVRGDAAKALGEYLKVGGDGVKEVVEGLFKVLKDSSIDWNVRGDAAKALGEYLKVGGDGVKEVVEGLFKVLKDSSIDWNVRCNAALALVKYLKVGGDGLKEVVEGLLKVLKDSSVEWRVRRDVVKALGEYLKVGGDGVKEVVEGLLKVLKDSSVDRYVRGAFAEALVEYLKVGGDGVKEVVEGLLKILKDSSVDRYVRGAAAFALGEYLKVGGDRLKEVVEGLLKVLKDSSVDGYVRGSAAKALREYLKLGGDGVKEVVEVLLKILKDSSVDGSVRGAAATALVKYLKVGGDGVKEVVEGLLKILKDSSVDGYVRGNAAYALVEYLKEGGDGVKEVVEGLLKILKDSSVHRSVRRDAAFALGEYLNLGGDGVKEVVEGLLKVLKDSSVDGSVRRDVAKALVEYLKVGGDGVKEVVEGLLKVLKDSSVQGFVRRYVAKALGEYLNLGGDGVKEVVEGLLKVLKDSSVEGLVRGVAAKALREYLKVGGDGVKEVVEGLLKVLKDSSVEGFVRDCAAKALGEVSAQQLAKMVSDTHSFKLALDVCYLTQKALTVSKKVVTISDNRAKISFSTDENYLKLIDLQKIITSSYSSLSNSIFDHSLQNTSSSSTSSSVFNASKESGGNRLHSKELKLSRSNDTPSSSHALLKDRENTTAKSSTLTGKSLAKPKVQKSAFPAIRSNDKTVLTITALFVCVVFFGHKLLQSRATEKWKPKVLKGRNVLFALAAVHSWVYVVFRQQLKGFYDPAASKLGFK
ncbi:HEAT repeat domain-containing protein [Candidatus Neptunochlamydia vexilliferae]|uniref:NACHT domain-containing protein n=1 Tax=Candidatus Neptunichlamydia vexilliferae TaxID=1651774 RepID=A0ABS0B0S2_9BACT|nr:HEAT repeat domain-containing protein [Candidatus Neptunochlamydia vexilliferae]MBF5059989.1 hypothetical protein [Candidatus Neptunochlamydia vexilliferae]